MNKLTSIFLITLVLGIMTANLAVAQYTPLEPLPCVPGQGLDCTGYNPNRVEFKTYVQYTFNLVIALAAAAAVFMIIYGGLIYMTADAFPIKNDGLQKVKNALFGLLLVLTSYTILKLVNPTLVQIPTTLVKPLNLTSKGSSISLLLDQYANYLDTNYQQFFTDKAAYDAEKASLLKTINEGKTQIAANQEQVYTLEDRISAILRDDLTSAEIDEACKNPDNAELRTLCAQRASLLENSLQANQVVIFNTSIAAMRAAIQQCRLDGSSTCFTKVGERAKIDVILSRNLPKLRPDLAAQLNVYALYASNWFMIAEKIVAKPTEIAGHAWGPTMTPYAKDWMERIVPAANTMKTAADSFVTYFTAHPNIVNSTELDHLKTDSQNMYNRVQTLTQELRKYVK